MTVLADNFVDLVKNLSNNDLYILRQVFSQAQESVDSLNDISQRYNYFDYSRDQYNFMKFLSEEELNRFLNMENIIQEEVNQRCHG